MNNEIISNALYAYQNIEFYKWFYNKKGKSELEIQKGDIPYFDKEYLFQYQKIYHKLYFDDIKVINNDRLIGTTTGTMGNILKTVYDENNLHFTDAIQSLLVYLCNDKNFNCKNLVIPSNVSEPLKTLYKSIKELDYFNDGHVIEIEDVKELEKKICNTDNIVIDMVIDTTLQIPRMYANNPDLVSKTKLKYIIYQTMEESLYKTLDELGVKLVSLYATMELGILGFTIKNKEKNVFHIFTDDILEVLDNNEQIIEKGHGQLVVTSKSSVFPYIRYCFNDIVDLSYDLELGKSKVKLYGRNMNVYIPNEQEANVNYQKILDYFIDLPFVRNVQILYLKNIEKQDSCIIENNILCTLIDINGTSIIKADSNFSEICMKQGMGVIVREYTSYFPVYFVSNHYLFDNGRNKNFFILTNGSKNGNWEHFYPVIDAIEHDFNYKIKD